MTDDRPAIVRRDLGRVPYAEALRLQRSVRDAVVRGDAPNTLLLVEHDPVVTLGRRGDRGGIRDAEALAAAGIDVVATERGGHVTYHGPGQLVAYPILDLRAWGPDLRAYVEALEGVVLDVLTHWRIDARADAGRHGVYTARGKIASIGIHVSRWVTMHGVALNVDPRMEHWALVAPCNLPGVEATSMALELDGAAPPPAAVRDAFAAAFARRFGVELREAQTSV